MTIRRLGVEEEMFLVDPETGRLAAISDRVIHPANSRTDHEELDQELFLQQLEITSDPVLVLDDLYASLREKRQVADAAARSAGATLMAVATPIVADGEGKTTPKTRYRTMIDEFGKVGRQSLVCGMHVHIEVDDAEAVAIIDEIRPWLPLVLALSVNSPFDHGVDTGYASWRSQLWDSWPTAGPVEAFSDLRGYRDAVSAMIASGAALDEGMIYFDARIARNFPTIEIRVADVCADLEDAVVIAGLVRAIVETAAQARRAGTVAEPWRIDLLRAARWRARRLGLSDTLLDPMTRTLQPAGQVMRTLLEHTRPALDAHGDFPRIEAGIARLLAEGTGAERQRSVAGTHLDLGRVVEDVISRTRASFA